MTTATATLRPIAARDLTRGTRVVGLIPDQAVTVFDLDFHDGSLIVYPAQADLDAGAPHKIVVPTSTPLSLTKPTPTAEPVRYFDAAKSRAWVAAHYSAESKCRVEFGEEATPEDRAAYAAAEAAGLFTV